MHDVTIGLFILGSSAGLFSDLIDLKLYPAARRWRIRRLSRRSTAVNIKFQAEQPDEAPTSDVMRRFNAVGLPAYVILRPTTTTPAN